MCSDNVWISSGQALQREVEVQLVDSRLGGDKGRSSAAGGGDAVDALLLINQHSTAVQAAAAPDLRDAAGGMTGDRPML